MSSIQDFLLANHFRLDEENEAFVRGPERIDFADLAGKTLSYFQERYELNELDRDLIEAETPYVSTDQANEYLHSRLRELSEQVIRSTTYEELSQAWADIRQTRTLLLDTLKDKSRSQMTLQERVAFVKQFGHRTYLALPE